MKHGRWHGVRATHSLRWRLVALFIALAAASALVFVAGTQRLVVNGFDVFVKPLLADYVDRLAAEIGSPPDVARAQALVQRLPVAVRIEGPVSQWDSSIRSSHGSNHGSGHGYESGLLVRTTADGHRLHFGIDTARWRAQWTESRWGGWVPLLGLVLLTAVAYAVVRRLIAPLQDIRAGALRFGAGDFSQPIVPRRRDELGELATQVNAMAESLQGMLGSQRELLLAISHELRSPLTRARLNAELLDESAEREALLRDLGVMRELIADLLEGERLAAGSAALQRERCDLNTLVREAVAALPNGATVLALAEPLPVLELDRPRIALLVRNLVDNALRHGAASVTSPVVLSTHAEPHGVRLTVRDHGAGVSEVQLARLAEPFFRTDEARRRATGTGAAATAGVGLGLYLCRQVARSHGASFELRNAEPGLEVTVRWPA